jgi:hypothetical protein
MLMDFMHNLLTAINAIKSVIKKKETNKSHQNWMKNKNSVYLPNLGNF